MQRNLKDIFLEILDIINYSKDKEKFFKEFEELNHLEAMMNIIDRMPLDAQKKIKTVIDDPGAIKQYIDHKLHLEEIIKVSNAALLQFLKDIEHTLTQQQKEKIAKLLQG